MRQSGILAAAGLVALDKMVNRLKEDHDHIYQIAQGKAIYVHPHIFHMSKNSAVAQFLIILPNLAFYSKTFESLETSYYTQFILITLAISDAKCDIFRVDLPSVQSNILMVYLDNTKISAQEFIQRLATVKSADTVKVSVKAMSRDNGCIRFTSYWEISNDDTKAAIAKIRLVIDEFKTNTTTTKTIQ